MPLFNVKRSDETPPTESMMTNGTPTEMVLQLRQQGLSNTQIVEAMQRDGYKTHQIFDAMNQADMVSGGPMGQGMGMGAAEDSAQQAQQEMQPDPAFMGHSSMGGGSYDAQIEEVAEAIIEEKWKEVATDINRVVEWKNETESKMAMLEQRFNDLKDQFDNVHAAIIGKVSEYDQSIKGVGAELKAMEKVFQDVLPKFTENINELSRITKATKLQQKK